MKDNLIQYLLEYRDKSFRQVPFSEADALLFAHLSYMKMRGIVPGFHRSDGVSWQQMLKHPQSGQLFDDLIYGKNNRKILHLICSSVRYRNIRTAYYMEWLDEKRETQFSAVTFLLGKNSTFVAYRGTDESLVGWKEDFNMGFMKSVPAQRQALFYLKGVTRYVPSGRLILGGHSKGGNLAVYASAFASEVIQERIRRIYSFDGPGFHPSFYEQDGFQRIEKKYCKIVPEQSLVGLLLTNYHKYRVVRSYRTGMLQHDPLQWKIKNGTFDYRKELYKKSRRISRILNAWVDSLDKEQIVMFVETIYNLMQSAQVKSVYAFLKKPIRILKKIRRTYKKMDKVQKSEFWKVLKKLLQAVPAGFRLRR